MRAVCDEDENTITFNDNRLHNHQPDYTHAEILRFRASLRERARNINDCNRLTLEQIYQEECER
jgi:hypothetical protein